MVGVGGNAISSEKQSWDRIGGWGEGGGTREFRSTTVEQLLGKLQDTK